MSRIVGWSEIMLEIKRDYLNGLLEILNEVEALWFKRLTLLEMDAQDIGDEKSRDEYYEFYQERFCMYEETFPKITKYNLLVSAFSYLEQNLDEYYANARKEYEISEKVSKKGVFYYINWFRKHFSDVLDKITKEKINEIRLLRNCIVHSNGKIEVGQFSNVLKIINDSEYLSLNRENEIIIESDYIINSFEVIFNIIQNIHRQIQKKI